MEVGEVVIMTRQQASRLIDAKQILGLNFHIDIDNFKCSCTVRTEAYAGHPFMERAASAFLELKILI